MQWKPFILAPAVAALLVAGPAGAETWKIDPPHTQITFSVNHFFTPVSGRFEDFDIKLDYNEHNPAKTKIEAKINVASVNTGNEMRDEHLRSADWFEAEKYPYMTFKSKSVRQVGNQLLAKGELTIKGKAQQVELPITLLGSKDIPPPMQAMLGGAQKVASFHAETSLARADYGVGVGSWAGTMVVGGDVRIEIQLEAHR